MKRFSRSFYVALFVFVVALGSASYGAEHYATTDMTWAEFYAGETGQTSTTLEELGLDAISTPTTKAITYFPLVISSSNDKGSTLSGVKAVQVRMSDEVYEALKGNARYDFSRYTFTDETFSEYKVVSKDGSFGKMVTETTVAEDAEVKLLSGADARWGSYMLELSNAAAIDIGTQPEDGHHGIARNFLGATIETSDRTIYGLRHDSNIWRSSSDIAITVNDAYVESHGTGLVRDYDYTASLVGKTITKITYMLKDLPDVEINCNVAVEPVATVRAKNPEGGMSATGGDLKVDFEFENVPDGVSYVVDKVQLGGGKGAVTLEEDTDYTVSGTSITLKEAAAGFYRVTFEPSDDSVSTLAGFYVKDAHYATTDMSYAEFYAAETGESAEALLSEGLDAISSATTYGHGYFPLADGKVVDGRGVISGLKAVQVYISNDVYENLTDKSRFTFINASDVAFKEYKVLSADGIFGKMVTATKEAEGAEVKVDSGASSAWGTYTVSISGAEIDFGTLPSDGHHGTARNLLGATLETDDGKIYGLRHDSNLWSEPKIALSINDKYIESHTREPRDYEYTEDLAGKSIKKITYMLKDLPDVVINCDAKLMN